MDLLYRHRKLKGVCLRNVSLADNSLYKLRREKEQTSNDMEARKAESCAKIEVFESGQKINVISRYTDLTKVPKKGDQIIYRNGFFLFAKY